jgi:hypothetical protein
MEKTQSVISRDGFARRIRFFISDLRKSRSLAALGMTASSTFFPKALKSVLLARSGARRRPDKSAYHKLRITIPRLGTP